MVFYQPFELKMHPKIGLLGPKIIPKHFLKNSEKNFGKSQTDFFEPQIVKTRVPTLAKKVDFPINFGSKSSNIALKVLKPKSK